MSIHNQRSTAPLDFQDLPQTIGAMSKIFNDGYETPLHDHDRDQLLYAISGTMRLRTIKEAWVVPPDGAIYIPAGTQHTVSMHGNVDMRTLYIDANTTHPHTKVLSVVAVSNLLRELILALSEEPVVHKANSRAGLISQMIELEIAQARDITFRVPLPHDPRLQRLCAALLSDPSDRRTLEAWSQISGASSRTLARLFERDLGMSFNQWRQRVRFHSALEALSDGVPISRVAAQNGYRSASAFTAAFSKAMGAPPSKVLIE
jgi:AraC-like DNA-binding protein